MAYQKGPNYIQSLGFNWVEFTPEAKTFDARIGRDAVRASPWQCLEDDSLAASSYPRCRDGLTRDRVRHASSSDAGGEWTNIPPGVCCWNILWRHP